MDIWSSCARGGDWSGHRQRHERVDRRGPSREHALTHKALQSTAIPDPALTMHPCDCSNACTLRHIPPVALLGSGTQHPTRLTDAVHRSSSTRLRSGGCSAGSLQHQRPPRLCAARRLQVPVPIVRDGNRDAVCCGLLCVCVMSSASVRDITLSSSCARLESTFPPAPRTPCLPRIPVRCTLLTRAGMHACVRCGGGLVVAPLASCPGACAAAADCTFFTLPPLPTRSRRARDPAAAVQSRAPCQLPAPS